MHLVFTVTLQSSDRQFSVGAGETVLEAAQRAGVALPYSCRAGVCGSCKATLLQGQCEYPRNPPLALSASALAHHAVLLCQAVPTSDLLLQVREVTSVEDMARRQLGMVVTDKWQLAPDVIGLRLLPAHGERRLNRLPGQYLDVLLEDGSRRPFSIANGPQAEGMIELHVRHVAGGGFTSWVSDVLKEGDTLRIEGPFGTFVPREDSERPMVFMAGGTGFAPVKAIVEHFIALGTRRSDAGLLGCAKRGGSVSARAGRTLGGRGCRICDSTRCCPIRSGRLGLRAGLVHEAVLEDQPGTVRLRRLHERPAGDDRRRAQAVPRRRLAGRTALLRLVRLRA